MKKSFTQILMNWHRHQNDREMPWKGEKKPYRIWLSEIILQQTRVEQGMGYYHRFIEQYPTIQALAKAPDQQVFKLWEGLGYYNRCRNLLHTAREIVEKRNGIFPDTYEELIMLKGVGPYTAAAIASFAYNLPYAVVDGNVFRVLARYMGIDIATDSTAGKKIFHDLAYQMLDKKEPASYNQAIMDFGATICKPMSPLCSVCPLQSGCAALATGKVNQLPLKEKTLQRRTRFFNYFILEYRQKIWVQQRMVKDIWQHLFEFYLLETDRQVHWDAFLIQNCLKNQLNIHESTVKKISESLVQQLTHQQIKGQFIHLQFKQKPASLKGGEWKTKAQIRELAFPKLIASYLPTIKS
ncbi:MAG: A/G-specific adenine glycosylase [Chitinophagaceae bacterium]|nr:A/G-specific adenine glycosylase [Chitinophagaceae bacterium]